MEGKISKPIVLRSNLSLTDTRRDKNYFSNYSNITGLFLPKFKKETDKGSLINSNSDSFIKNNRKTDNNFYNKLQADEKINYINKLIKNCMKKDIFDNMAVRRKKISISELIHQFDVTNKTQKFEDNKIFKVPYPLLYFISNRKFENNSSNLLRKILTKENNLISKNQELTIKYSKHSKIFNTDISKLINDENENRKIYPKTPKRVIENISIFNKYLKQRFNNMYFQEKYKNLNSISKILKFKQMDKLKNMKRYNSSKIEKNKIKNDEFRNIFEAFKNKSVNLHSHNNNMKNSQLIQERLNNIMEGKFFGSNKINFDPGVNKIIKDISHLKFNNKIMPIGDKIVNDI